MANGRAGQMSWLVAIAWSVAIVVYFAATTVFVPSLLARSGALIGSSDLTRGLVVAGVWLAFLAAGMWTLRWAQRTDRI